MIGFNDLRIGGAALERFLILGPKLVHDDAVRHVHEGEPHRRFCGSLGIGRPAEGIHKRQREGNARALQKGPAIDRRFLMHGFHCLTRR
jgi:hypothetical protein